MSLHRLCKCITACFKLMIFGKCVNYCSNLIIHHITSISCLKILRHIEVKKSIKKELLHGFILIFSYKYNKIL